MGNKLKHKSHESAISAETHNRQVFICRHGFLVMNDISERDTTLEQCGREMLFHRFAVFIFIGSKILLAAKIVAIVATSD